MKRASLHNEDILRERRTHRRPVIIQKAGEIIPEVVEVVKANAALMKTISCLQSARLRQSGKTSAGEVALRCPIPPARPRCWSGLFTLLPGAMDIAGLRPAAAEQLLTAGWFKMRQIFILYLIKSALPQLERKGENR